MFKIDNISFSYQNTPVICDLSLELEKGKFYAIMGPNGCGKTTFLDLLVVHTKPDHGTIYYKDKNIALYSKKNLSKEISLVSQNFYINFPFTVHEIVMMGRYPYIPRFATPSKSDFEMVDYIMQITGIYKFKKRFITELSGGERQRVVFARALVQDTSVLILDEATSNLDINHTLSMLNIAAKKVSNEQKTVIAVLHDINVASIYSDYILFMKNGTMMFHGPVDKVLNKENIKTIFDVNAKIYFDSYCDSHQVVFKPSKR